MTQPQTTTACECGDPTCTYTIDLTRAINWLANAAGQNQPNTEEN